MRAGILTIRGSLLNHMLDKQRPRRIEIPEGWRTAAECRWRRKKGPKQRWSGYFSLCPFPSQAFTATSKTLADSSFRPMTMISAGSSKPKSCSSPKGRRNNATAASLAFGRSFGERQGFEKISWEETEKQKARMCRAQELARSRAQENERQKRAAMEISDSRDEERTAVS